jgi:hypothetical protein
MASAKSLGRVLGGAAGLVLLLAAVLFLALVVLPLAYLVAVAALVPFLLLLGLTHLGYWVVARLAAYGFPDTAGPWHRWPAAAIWLVALVAGAAAAGALAAPALWEAYAGAVTAPVATLLQPLLGKPCAAGLAGDARMLVSLMVAPPGPGWARPLTLLALLAACRVRGRHEAEAVRVAGIDADPARRA